MDVCMCVCFFKIKCIQPECRSRAFAPSRSSPLTQTVDWQIIKQVYQYLQTWTHLSLPFHKNRINHNLKSEAYQVIVLSGTFLFVGLFQIF